MGQEELREELLQILKDGVVNFEDEKVKETAQKVLGGAWTLMTR